MYAVMERCLYEHTGIRLNAGKTTVYNRGGVKPDGVEALQPPGPDAERVWVGDHSLPAEQQGVVVLGAPLGIQRFAEEHGKEKLEKEFDLLGLVAQVPDLQCAWVLLLLCCAPRANYNLRTQPPEQAAVYAVTHDSLVWEAFCKLLERDDLAQHHQLDSRHAWLAQLPMRLGGCGLRSALRTAPAAWWASWADTLPMIRARHPEVAERLYQQLQGNRVATPTVAAVQEAQRHLAEKGYQCLEWDLVWNGAQPNQGSELEPGE